MIKILTFVLQNTFLFLLAGNAFSATFAFYQDGYSGNAFISGEFTGSDHNGDNIISSLDNEISSFSLTFSGNSNIPSFSRGLDDLGILVYVLDGGPIGDNFDLGEQLITYTDTFIYRGGPTTNNPEGCANATDCGFVYDVTQNISETSPNLVQVSSVPLPGASIFFLSGLLPLAFICRKRLPS